MKPPVITEVRGPFDAAEYERRVAAVRAVMAEQDVSAVLIASPENIYYLIGLSHQGYFAFTMLILRAEGRPLIVTRAMERATIARQAPDVDHVGYEEDEDSGLAAVEAVRSAGITGGRIGIDLTSMFFPPDAWEQLRTGLPDVEWLDTSGSPSTESGYRTGMVDRVRLIKSDAEIRYLHEAAAISDRATRAGMAAAGVGANEREVAAEIYRAMVLGGGEYPGFAPLIRSTDNLMEEHATWSDRMLTRGDKLFVELSGTSARYHAPLGRMAYIASAPDGAQKAYEVATQALEAVRATLEPGVKTGEVYEAWQRVVDEGLGHSRLRRHHCGYTVGIGFPPSWVGGSAVLGIRRGGQVRVRERMAFHLLSWVTDAALGDYFVSDTALVTENGAELLTTTPRKLLID